jgi:hypothetical protein
MDEGGKELKVWRDNERKKGRRGMKLGKKWFTVEFESPVYLCKYNLQRESQFTVHKW